MTPLNRISYAPFTELLSLLVATALLALTPQLPGRSQTTEPAQSQLGSTLAQRESAANRLANANRLSSQAFELWQMSQHQIAWDRFQQALELYQAPDVREAFPAESSIGEANTLTGLGLVSRSFGEYLRALAYYELALELQQAIGNRSGEETTLNNIGLAYRMLGQYERALSYYQDALVLNQETNDQEGEGIILNNIGSVYINRGQYERALSYYQDALVLNQEIGDRRSESYTLSNVGLVYYHLGQYERALSNYQAALVIRREVGDRNGESITLNNIGLVYEDLGQYEQALSYYQTALVISQEINNQNGEGTTFHNIGAIYDKLGQYERALSHYQAALAIQQAIGDRQGEGATLNNIGGAYISLKQYEPALSHYQAALAIAQEINNRSGEGKTFNNIGTAYSKLGQHERALSHYQAALIIAQEIGDRAGAAIAFNNQGTTLINLGNFAEAVPVLQQSIQIFESLRTDLPDSQLITLADTQRAAYQYLELALVAQGQDDEALAVTERGRGRAFVLQLASRLASEEERAALEASSVTQIPTVAEIQQIARDTQTTFVTYSLQFDQALYIWVVRPTGEIEFRFVAFENDDSSGLAFNPLTSINGPLYRTAENISTITELVANLRNVGIRVSLDDSAQAEQLQQLYQILIDPIADLLPTDPNAKVVFVPQGSLFLVPFAALQDAEGTYLIEKHTIVTVPAIQVLGLADRVGAIRDRPSYRMPQQTNNALIVGNPLMPSIWVPTADGLIETQLTNLPGAQGEAEQIASFFNTDVLTGNQASEAQIKQQIETADLIHLATHGLLEYGDPQASGVRDLPGAIALAPGSGEDGLLTAAEILQLDLNADLVVLSACDTGRGRITGDGVVGLSRSLITAGVPSVVVSLWSVPDTPTAELMVTFYQQLQQGQTKAQALRQAMLQMVEQGLSPRDWAAFTLVGAAE